MPTSNFSPVPLLSSFPLGPGVADLTHSSHDARNAPRARVPMGSLFAWVPRRPGGSWGTHHPGCTQGFPLGTHSHLCQLLLHHLQHHILDVLVAGISARHALPPGQSGQASVANQSSRAGGSGIALHPRGACIAAGAWVAGFSADSLLSLGPRLARLALRTQGSAVTVTRRCCPGRPSVLPVPPLPPRTACSPSRLSLLGGQPLPGRPRD